MTTTEPRGAAPAGRAPAPEGGAGETAGVQKFLMEFRETADALGAFLIPGEAAGFSGVALDSRAVTGGGLFVALPGAATDGHRYVEAAFAAGAAGALVARSRVEDPALDLAGLARRRGRALLVVEDALRGLQATAGAYLRKFPRLVRVAVTGSSGKTTTKELAAAILGQEKRVVTNRGNLNSETGLPLSVFAVRPWHEVGIFEAGSNRPGEIAELAGVLRPRLALVTNIGSAHAAVLGGREGIAREKKAIFSFFSEYAGTGIVPVALIPRDDPFRDFLADGVRGDLRFWGADAPSRELGLDGSEILWEGTPCRLRLPGAFNLKNAFAAIAIARELGAGGESVRAGLEAARPLFGRGEILRGPVTVIRDCYNSNPESLEAALAFLDSVPWPGRRVPVIGSMLELGEELSPAAHRRAGELLAARARGGDKIFLYGEETRVTAEALEERGTPVFHAGSLAALDEALAAWVRPGDLVLLKGSRGCALEKLEFLKKFEETGAAGETMTAVPGREGGL